MPFCQACGAEVSSGISFCPKCGAPVGMMSQPQPTAPRGRPSKAWYLLPIFLSIIGGIIGYVVIRKDDKQMANRLLIVGVVIFVLSLILRGALFH